MNFIVGLQVYQQSSEDGNSPLLVIESSICTVVPEEGVELSITDLAQGAAQIHAAVARKNADYEVQPHEQGYSVRKKEGNSVTLEKVSEE